MKFAAALGILGALFLASPARAISVHVVEDSPTRFSFDVVWGEALPSDTEDYAEVDGGVFNVRAHDLHFFGLVTADSLFGLDSFDILFDWSDARGFGNAVLDSFDGAQFLALDNEEFGGRFVYGAPYEAASVEVSDGGSALGMLLGGVLGLGWWKGRQRRTKP